MTNHQPRTTNNDSGFTLFEVLIALLILALGLASIFSLYGVGTHAHRSGLNDVILSNYAATVFAELEHKLNSGVELNDLSDQTHPAFPGYFRYDLSIKPLSAETPQELLVTLTIKWDLARGKGAQRFQTVLIKTMSGPSE